MSTEKRRPEITGRNQARGRFKPGQSGNPKGKPKGARNLTARMLDELAAGSAEQIVKRLLKRASRSDAAAITILARVWPVPRGRSVAFKLPPVRTAEDASKAVAAVLRAAAAGELTPEEADRFVAMTERFVRVLDRTSFEARLRALETATGLAAEPEPEEPHAEPE